MFIVYVWRVLSERSHCYVVGATWIFVWATGKLTQLFLFWMFFYFVWFPWWINRKMHKRSIFTVFFFSQQKKLFVWKLFNGFVAEWIISIWIVFFYELIIIVINIRAFIIIDLPICSKMIASRFSSLSIHSHLFSNSSALYAIDHKRGNTHNIHYQRKATTTKWASKLPSWRKKCYRFFSASLQFAMFRFRSWSLSQP